MADDGGLVAGWSRIGGGILHEDVRHLWLARHVRKEASQGGASLEVAVADELSQHF